MDYDPDRAQKLISSSMSPDICRHATFHPNPCTRFWVILLTDRQTDRQTDKHGQKHLPPRLSEVNSQHLPKICLTPEHSMFFDSQCMLCILGSMNLTTTDQKLNNEKNRATKPDKFELIWLVVGLQSVTSWQPASTDISCTALAYYTKLRSASQNILHYC